MTNFFTNNKISRFIFLSLFLLFIFLSAGQSLAQTTTSYNFNSGSGLETTGNKAGYTWKSAFNIDTVAGQIIQIILSLLGVIFLAFIIYAGILWMTAQGNEQKIEKAKSMIIESIIGLIIVVIAYTIAYFVINFFSNGASV